MYIHTTSKATLTAVFPKDHTNSVWERSQWRWRKTQAHIGSADVLKNSTSFLSSLLLLALYGKSYGEGQICWAKNYHHGVGVYSAGLRIWEAQIQIPTLAWKLAGCPCSGHMLPDSPTSQGCWMHKKEERRLVKAILGPHWADRYKSSK